MNLSGPEVQALEAAGRAIIRMRMSRDDAERRRLEWQVVKHAAEQALAALGDTDG